MRRIELLFRQPQRPPPGAAPLSRSGYALCCALPPAAPARIIRLERRVKEDQRLGKIYQTTSQKARRTAHNNRELATTTRLVDHAVLLLASDLPGYDLQLIDNITQPATGRKKKTQGVSIPCAISFCSHTAGKSRLGCQRQ